MDLSAILPLLLRSGGDRSDLLASLLPENDKTAEMMKLVSVMNEGKKKPVGLKPIRTIAPDDILGAMIKYFERPA